VTNKEVNFNQKNVTPTITKLSFSAKSNLKIKTALANFVKKDSIYKKQFLQSKYNTAFDGYSYLGQKDSINQYENDMLHSFVISEFQDIEDFPKEFHNFLKEDWKNLITTIKNTELAKINELNIPELTQLYNDNIIGYMMSCNYYPKPISCKSKAKNNTRLSAHKDASLFTTFPYGLDDGLSVLDSNNNYVKIEKKENPFLFSGYFLEFMTHKKIPALNHQVDLPKDLDSERFSFAVFSIPKPDATFLFNGKKISSTDYYKKYLSLF